MMTSEERYRRWEKALRWPMIALAVVFLLLLLLPLQAGVPPAALAWGNALETIIWIVFGLEFLFLLLLAPDKTDYLSSHVIEILGLLLPALRVFRALRVLRFLRLGRTPLLVMAVVRNLRRARALFDRFRLGYVLLVSLALLLGGAGILFVSEGRTQPGFASYATCLWWCVFALVSTSFDLGAPRSIGGNAIGLLMMILGIALAGIFTAAVASVFVRITQRQDRSAENTARWRPRPVWRRQVGRDSQTAPPE